VAKRKTVTRYRLDDRIELALNLRPPKEGVIRHRGHVTHIDHENRCVWVLFDRDTKIVNGKRTHKEGKSAHILHESAPNLRKLNLLELLAEAASD
jgi:hypothetical protein